MSGRERKKKMKRLKKQTWVESLMMNWCKQLEGLLYATVILFATLFIISFVLFSFYYNSKPKKVFSFSISMFIFFVISMITLILWRTKQILYFGDSGTTSLGFMELDNLDESSSSHDTLSNQDMRLTTFVRKNIIIIFSLLFVLMIFIFVLWLLILIPYRSDIYPHEHLETCMVGAVSDSQARIFARTPRHSSFSVKYREKLDTSEWLNSEEVNVYKETDFTGISVLIGLKPSTEYEYYINVGGTDKKLQKRLSGNFKTFSPSNEGTKFSFSYGSCVRRKWSSLIEFQYMNDCCHPDFVMMIGDTIYFDNPFLTEETTSTIGYLNRYRNLLADRYFSTFRKQVPVFYMYDDHELENDWDGSKPEPYQAAIDSWYYYAGALNPPTKNESPVVRPSNLPHYYSFNYGNVDFYVFDTRAFRSRNNEVDSINKTMLGARQMNHFLKWLSTSTAPFKFIVTSVPWTLAIKGVDGWYGYQTERQFIMNYIRTRNITGVVFLSGDQHYSGIFQISEGVFEFSNSPLAAFTVPIFSYLKVNETASNDSPIYLYDGTSVSGNIEVDTTVTPHSLVYSLHNNEKDPAVQSTLITRVEFILENGVLKKTK